MDRRLDDRSAESIASFELSTSRGGWCRVARMARIGVRSRSLKLSVATRILLNHAASAHPSELTRTPAPRQAGGHWFEPSTAHISSCKEATSVASFANEIR